MPLTKRGKEIKRGFTKTYGERGEEVFYRSLNKGVLPRRKIEKKK